MKKWSKLVLVAMVSLGTMLVSGCIDNIEPAGIANLRGAKAELLRAQTALQAAQAAKVEAEAALVLASAKVQEAIAKQEEAKALMLQYQAELQQAQNEEQRALIEKNIADIEAQALVAAENLKAYLLDAQAATARSQAAYEQALRDLAIAKNTLTTTQQEAIAGLETAVKHARDEVETKTKALEAAAKQLATMLAEVDEAKINKAVFALAEREVIKAKAYLEGKIEAEAEAKAALELDPSVTDWEAKVEAYEAEIAKLDSEWYKKDAEIDEQMAPMRDSVSATGVITTKVTDYTAYTGYSFNTTTGFFSKIKGATSSKFPIGEVVVTAPVDKEGTALFGGDFNLNTPEYTYGDEDDVIKVFETRLKALSKINAKTYETNIAYYNKLIASYKEDPEYKHQLAKYNDAVAAYKAGDVLPYFNKYVFDEGFDLTVAVKEYNDALKAMEAAVANYNSEYAKYNSNFDAEAEAAALVREKAYADAEIAWAKAYQKAEDDNKYTYNKERVWPAAEIAWENAQAAYEMAVEAAEDAGGDSQENMAAFVEAYDPTAATEVQKATYATYTAALKAIADAEKAKTAAKAEYDKAKEAWEKVDKAYGDAIAKADKAKADADAAALAAYNKAIDAIAAKGYPTFDPDYSNNLLAQVEVAAIALQDKVNAIKAVLYHFGSFNYELIGFELISGIPVVFTNVPEFMYSVAVEPKGDWVYSMNSIAVADFVDKEYFKDNQIAGMYADLTTVRAAFYVYNVDNTSQEEHVTTLPWGVDTENAPLELPTPEEYKAAWANANFNDVPSWLNNLIPAIAQSHGWVNYDWRRSFIVPCAYFADYFYANYIAENEEAIANLALLPDFVKAIEAAQAEFEALVKENADKLAADKAEVEAFYAKYLAAEEKAADELEAIKAKNDAIKVRYNAMKSVITEYCNAKKAGTATVDALVSALQANYEAAVADVINAEQAVINAEKAIEDLKAGVVSAADAAQRAYDRAAEELAEAIAKLERAAASLEAVLDAIYNDQPVPETPVDPEDDEDAE